MSDGLRNNFNIRLDTFVTFDIEVAWNFFYVAVRRYPDGALIEIEKSDWVDTANGQQTLLKVLSRYTNVGYNSLTYDLPMCLLYIEGATNEQLKRASDRIINGNLRWWEIEDTLGVSIPWKIKERHIDLIEPQPNPVAGLKTINGRKHSKQLQDLPFDHTKPITEEMAEVTRQYCRGPDVLGTEALALHLMGELELRKSVTNLTGVNCMSKSDTQMGLAIIKDRVERALGRKVAKPKSKAGWSFKYKAPDYIELQTPQLRTILERIGEHDFSVDSSGKVEMPDWLSKEKITIGPSTFTMGIGGLHSTESNRAVVPKKDQVIVSGDVAAFYPAIILTLGLYPEATGPVFLEVYAEIRKERLVAKKAKDKVSDKSLKISLNGAFGSLGSRYSFLYAPDLLIAVTLTGQLALLMMIERAFLAGIPTISANTDGAEFLCPKSMFDGFIMRDGKPTDRMAPSAIEAITSQWEKDTGFDLEFVEYIGLYNLSVNSYYALKADGTHKRKGPLSNPWSDDPSDKDPRASLMKNPQMTICSDAALAMIKHGTPVEETIRACVDMRQFVTVIKAAGGATWNGCYLGKVVRYYWGIGGQPIYKAVPDARTGTFGKVAKTDGAIECMTLTDAVPDDLDYDRYIEEANEILRDVGFYTRPPVVKPRRIKTVKRKAAVWLLCA